MHNREVLGQPPADQAGEQINNIEPRAYDRVPPSVKAARRAERFPFEHRHAVAGAGVVEADARHRARGQDKFHPGAFDGIGMPVLEIGHYRDAVRCGKARVVDSGMAHEEQILAGIEREDFRVHGRPLRRAGSGQHAQRRVQIGLRREHNPAGEALRRVETGPRADQAVQLIVEVLDGNSTKIVPFHENVEGKRVARSNPEAFFPSITASELESLWGSLETKQVALSLPKFKYESSFSLGKTLGQLGMSDALTPGAADFSGMDGSRDLFISDILHKAVVAVDEDGTEAAAATAVVVGITSLPVIDVQLTVDRPFIFAIRDTQSGAMLFLGQVVNPK